jgi:hypothetical protein
VGLLSSVLDLNPVFNADQFKIRADATVSQMNIPRGCLFCLKCPEVSEQFAVIEPELQEVSKGHFVASLKV